MPLVGSKKVIVTVARVEDGKGVFASDLDGNESRIQRYWGRVGGIRSEKSGYDLIYTLTGRCKPVAVLEALRGDVEEYTDWRTLRKEC